MTQKPNLLICFALIGMATPVGAQVIEIDSDGNAQTYSAPTTFVGGGAAPITIRETSPQAAFVDVDRTIAEASRRHGVDRGLLAAVALQESGGNMRAVSPKGARGVMQLMPGTAAELGVRINDVTDNIHGGAIYLRRQIDRFGSVPLALAAYNAGPGAVERYRGIPPYRETRNYVSRIMARWRPVTLAGDVQPQVTVTLNPNVIEVPAL